MENDLAEHPENTDFTPFWSLFGNRDAKKTEGKCPFAAMFMWLHERKLSQFLYNSISLYYFVNWNHKYSSNFNYTKSYL